MQTPRSENGVPAPVLAEETPGFRSVHPDRTDPRVFLEYSFEIVDCRTPNVRIKASFPFGYLQHVPQRDSTPVEKCPLQLVIRPDGFIVDAGKNTPEMIAGTCVVFAYFQ